MEWFGEDGSGDSAEVICGVSNDCILLPSSAPVSCNVGSGDAGHIAMSNGSTYEMLQPVDAFGQQPLLRAQDFVEIEVTEEEVITEDWGNGGPEEIVAADVKPNVYTSIIEDNEIPLPQDQDAYSQLHPYPCDFCSRRFSKKSTLVTHMVSHQTERPHGCNLCGARYRRKIDLVNHMKIHAYAPVRSVLEDEEDDSIVAKRKPAALDVGIKGRRKKSLIPKMLVNDSLYDAASKKTQKKLFKSRTKKGAKGGLLSKGQQSYVDEDMRLLSEMSRNANLVHQVPRWPVVNQDRPYVCQHCGVGFAREKALASHSRVHAGDSPFECDVCGEMFWDVTLLREHARLRHPHHLDARPPSSAPAAKLYTGDDRFGNFYCDTCGVAFHRLDLLKRHRKSHVKGEVLQEENNGADGGEEEEEDEGHICKTCGLFFERTAELETHVADAHSEMRAVVVEPSIHRCMVCGQAFVDPLDLANHVRHGHGITEDNVCELCGKTCKDHKSLQKHAWVHSENRSFPCNACAKRFHSRARLRRHMVSHRDKAVSCSDCGEEFPDGRALLSHRHSHNTGGSGGGGPSAHPARSFPCHDCGKTFGSRSSQQIHVRIHTGERPYGCRFCWKAFADGGTLRKHERIHTGEKPYVCPVCPKAFNQRVVLREHIRAHHSGADAKVNSCFECKVCGYLFGSSSELCLHLVQHSDENTAKHRLPNMGPRKYKRRRKMGPREGNNVFTGVGISEDLDDTTDSNDDLLDSSEKRRIEKKKYKLQEGSNGDGEDLDSVVKACASALENLNSMVNEDDQKKARMEKLLKKRKLGADKQSRLEKRAKAAKLMNNTSYASKYVVSRPEDGSTSEQQFRPRNKILSPRSSSKDVISNGSDYSRKPRTKNVNYHNMKMAKFEPARFPVNCKAVRKKKNKKIVEQNKVDYPGSVENLINGIDLESLERASSGIVDSLEVDGEKLETCIVQDMNEVEIKLETTVTTGAQQMEGVKVKSELLACEMCSEMFSERSDLMNHIRVHI